MSDRAMNRGPYDGITAADFQKVEDWEKDKKAQALFQSLIREFVEKKPLYSRHNLTLPPGRTQFHVDVARLYCDRCKTTQPFRRPKFSQWYHILDKELRTSEKQALRKFDLLKNCIYPVELYCTECEKGFYDFFVLVNVEKGTVTKFGQFPMWTPNVDKELRKELGASAMFYVNALQNLNFGYGIGACAYFRRMVEDFINPLLTLLHDYKKDSGASEEELQEIQKAIASRAFSEKTEFAAKICPPDLFVSGMNPLKELHDQLSASVHAGTDNEATEFALKIQSAIEFVVTKLRKHYDAQKQFVDTMKKNRKESP